MFRNSKTKMARVPNLMAGKSSTIGRAIRARKSNIETRIGRKLLAEQLEARNLFAGLALESVITTESDFPVGKSYAYAVAADLFGNTYMGGQFTGTADFDRNTTHADKRDVLTARGYSDAFVAKYDPAGQFLWARRMGGDSAESSDDTGYGIETDNSGNVFLTGNFGQTADFGGTSLASVGLRDSYLAKLDSNGNFLWAAGLGTEVDDFTTQIEVHESGSVTVATVSNLGSGQSATRIRQFDAIGTQLWLNEIGANAFQMRSDASGDLYIAGHISATVDLDPGQGEYLVTGSSTTRKNFVSKITNNGEFQWATSIAWEPSDYASSFQMLGSIAVGQDGSIALMGSYAAGDVRIEQGNSVSPLPSFDSRRAFFTLLDASTGGFQSYKAYEGNFRSQSLISTTNGYAVTGITASTGGFNPVASISLSGLGNNDVFLMTLDQTGNVSWAGLVGGSSIDSVFQIKSDRDGGVLVPGYSASAAFDFDPSPVRSTTVSNVASFVLKLKPMLATKFYVVDDASSNRTYEYAADHSTVENYTLNSGNTAPRGAASTVAGDKVWVVDANKKVYIYNDSGVLLGSWTAGSVASNATIEGIATNGTDVWLVDARQDRVYRYANAASRLSGSQNAASNFALNSGNRSPKDLVTDGTNIWVVNDSTTDKVFKYTMTGSLVGSWTIASANSKPTGLTIDPSGASQSIWIVDNGTDRVYEYTNARSRNSGSQSAVAWFALSSANGNPQGIADPPASSSTPVAPVDSAISLNDFAFAEFSGPSSSAPMIESHGLSAIQKTNLRRLETRPNAAPGSVLRESFDDGVALFGSSDSLPSSTRLPRSLNWSDDLPTEKNGLEIVDDVFADLGSRNNIVGV